MTPSSRPKAFASARDFRAWLESHHATATELTLRLFRVHARDQGMGYAEALDEALCFGWIDGVRRTHDGDSFTVRFTPRRAKSIWSAVNIRRVGALIRAGRMWPAGLTAFRAREEKNSRRYSFESKPLTLDPALEKRLRARKRAWDHFQSRPPWYRRTCIFWVMSAKREETRARRLDVVIENSERGKDIPALDRTERGKGARPLARPPHGKVR